MSGAARETGGFLQGLIQPRLVFTNLAPASLEDALAEMASRAEEAGVVSDAADLTRRLLERERLGCTGLGAGIAIPHCKLKDVDGIVLAVGACPAGVDFHAPDGIAVTLIFLILSPAQAPALHLQALARISRLLKVPGVADSLRRAQTPEALVAALREAEGAVTVARG
ncbi:MAG: PTS sugar transporter subunit IIA [Acidobacteriota bacterium]|nr:PTS sugar transporter subunit IIA [Acidobacteriota bacterium]MDQ2978167.1 PTS sugar transporter subunit IIA [Acidobacteriota bacterium]